MNASDVIAYHYKDGIYCRDHILSVLPTGEGEEFDGWALAPGADPMTPEDNLREVAIAFGFHNSVYGTEEFPHPIFATPDELVETIGHVCDYHTDDIATLHTIGEAL